MVTSQYYNYNYNTGSQRSLKSAKYYSNKYIRTNLILNKTHLIKQQVQINQICSRWYESAGIFKLNLVIILGEV